jgi:subtilisin family serine protease
MNPVSYPPSMPEPRAPKRKGRPVLIVLMAVSALLVISCAGVLTFALAGSSKPTGSAPLLTAPDGSLSPSAKAPTPAKSTSKPSAADLERLNAGTAALEYLGNGQGFSRKGLIKQLSSEYGEDYPVKTATEAVDILQKAGVIDWNEEAVKSAQSYLSSQSFSRKGLIKQLESSYGEGFTHAQAVYGVDHAGL